MTQKPAPKCCEGHTNIQGWWGLHHVLLGTFQIVRLLEGLPWLQKLIATKSPQLKRCQFMRQKKWCSTLARTWMRISWLFAVRLPRSNNLHHGKSATTSINKSFSHPRERHQFKTTPIGSEKKLFGCAETCWNDHQLTQTNGWKTDHIAMGIGWVFPHLGQTNGGQHRVAEIDGQPGQTFCFSLRERQGERNIGANISIVRVESTGTFLFFLTMQNKKKTNCSILNILHVPAKQVEDLEGTKTNVSQRNKKYQSPQAQHASWKDNLDLLKPPGKNKPNHPQIMVYS